MHIHELYACLNLITVTLSSSSGDVQYRGLLVQGRQQADMSPVGSFSDFTSTTRQSSCTPPEVQTPSPPPQHSLALLECPGFLASSPGLPWFYLKYAKSDRGRPGRFNNPAYTKYYKEGRKRWAMRFFVGHCPLCAYLSLCCVHDKIFQAFPPRLLFLAECSHPQQPC